MSASLVFTLFMFDMNSGPFKNSCNYVDMASSSHGNPIFFTITAISGSLFIISLAKLTPVLRTLTYIGKNTLVLLGLNGIFYNFINKRLIEWLNYNIISGSPSLCSLLAALAALFQIALCVPFVHILSKYFPELIGNIKTKGVITLKIFKIYKSADY
jgi:acyltransferase